MEERVGSRGTPAEWDTDARVDEALEVIAEEEVVEVEVEEVVVEAPRADAVTDSGAPPRRPTTAATARAEHAAVPTIAR